MAQPKYLLKNKKIIKPYDGMEEYVIYQNPQKFASGNDPKALHSIV